MKRCVILIPLTFNDGTEVPPQTLTTIMDRLYNLFGGYTIRGEVHGAYQMSDGNRADDVSLEVWVAADEKRIDELRKEISRICAKLQQESIYFEKTDSEIEFVTASLFES